MKFVLKTVHVIILMSYILIYNISHKTFVGAKSFCIRFNKIDEFIRVYDGTRYLVLFGTEKCDFFYKRVRYLVGIKHRITYVICHNYARIKVDSYDLLPLEKALTFHNVITHIKSVWKKD